MGNSPSKADMLYTELEKKGFWKFMANAYAKHQEDLYDILASTTKLSIVQITYTIQDRFYYSTIAYHSQKAGMKKLFQNDTELENTVIAVEKRMRNEVREAVYGELLKHHDDIVSKVNKLQSG